MKKNQIASAIAIATFVTTAAQADIQITNMRFATTDYLAGGILTSAGDGEIHSIEDFFMNPWTASQQTIFMDNTQSWANNAMKNSGAESSQGFYDYDANIAAMTGSQVAVGMFFNWNGNNDIAVLEIFDCIANVCTGNGIPMANGPFGNGNPDGTPTNGSRATFSGTVVPVPATAWLMGSGLLGLIGVARRSRRASV